MGDIAPLVRRPVPVSPEQTYREIGIRSFARGVFHKNPTTGLEIGDKRVFAIEPGDLLFNIVFAWEGAVAVASEAERGTIGSHRFLTCVTNDDLADSRFLFWWFSRGEGREQLLRASPGGAGRNRTLGVDKLAVIKVPLPPIQEQRRIVRRIEEVAEAIAKATGLRRESIEAADTLFASAVEEYFSGKPGWQKLKVGDFCESPQYGYTASATSEPIGPRLLRITDIQDGEVSWDSVPYCLCPDPDKYLLRRGDLLFARTGGTIGKSFVIRNCPEAVFASYLIRLRVKSCATVDYLARYFQSQSYWAQIADKKSGTGQPNLNGEKLRNIVVPIAPAKEQLRIVDDLQLLQTRVDEVRRLQAETADEINAVIPALLAQAFRGEL
jgi:type I restriction enzyme S subunit